MFTHTRAHPPTPTPTHTHTLSALTSACPHGYTNTHCHKHTLMTGLSSGRRSHSGTLSATKLKDTLSLSPPLLPSGPPQTHWNTRVHTRMLSTHTCVRTQTNSHINTQTQEQHPLVVFFQVVWGAASI